MIFRQICNLFSNDDYQCQIYRKDHTPHDSGEYGDNEREDCDGMGSEEKREKESEKGESCSDWMED
jgi:hypothetical protein